MKRRYIGVLLGMILLVAFALSSSVSAPSYYGPNPQKSSGFAVEISGVTVGPFTSVEGIGSEMEVIEYRAGADGNYVSFTGGNAYHGPLTLRRIIGESDEMWTWYQNNLRDVIDKKSMSVIFFDRGHNEVLRCNLYECWPSAYYIEPAESSPSDVIHEVIVVQYEYMEIV